MLTPPSWGPSWGPVELVALAPDVVMAFTSIAVASLRQVTRAVPIVFAVVADAIGAGYVESLARRVCQPRR
jgi:ABC-type uncharacterized transport system substrate-binding protein